VKYSQR